MGRNWKIQLTKDHLLNLSLQFADQDHEKNRVSLSKVANGLEPEEIPVCHGRIRDMNLLDLAL